jgi:hypothetical protein
VPQSAEDYYGPNEALRTALRENANTWRMIYREAAGNDRHATVKTGELMGVYPAIIIRTVGDAAELTLTGGLAYVPISFTGLSSPRGHRLMFDGQPVNQAIHGSDYWQTDYDARARCWTRTYNLPIGDDKPHSIRFERKS